jgi:hypothetical protein
VKEAVMETKWDYLKEFEKAHALVELLETTMAEKMENRLEHCLVDVWV